MKKALFFILIFFLSENLCANDKLSFRNFDVKSGISDNYVQSILRDQYGFMWFATLNGLNRYDGYQFKKYTVTQLGAYNNDIESITEDGDGTIWLKGPISYYIYDREQDKIENRTQPLLNKYGINGEVSYLTIDKDHNLWCTVNNTLYYYDFKQKELHHFLLPEGNRLVQLVSRKGRTYLLFANGDIASISSDFRSIETVTQRKLLSGMQYYIYLDTVDKLWFYTSHASGLQCYDINNKQWINDTGHKELENALITTVMDDGYGNLWIGTDNKGIYVRYSHKRQLVWINKSTDNPFSLADNHINCFFKDSQNTMWVGTSKQGVSFADLDKITFKTYFLSGQEDVKCIQEDNNGNLWLGFDGEGLSCYRTDKQSHTHFKIKELPVPSDLIICSCLDSKNRIWFGTYGGSAFYEQNGVFTSVHYPSSNENDNPLRYIRRIVEDESGTIWFGTFMQGLYSMDSSGHFTPYTMDSSILLTGSITDLAYSKGRNLYIGTSSGLYYIDIYTQKITPLTGNKAGTQLLSDSYITSLYHDSRGLLWIGTRSGMIIFDEKKDEMIHLSTENGLSHNCIRAIAEDKYNNLWATTDHGITNIVVMNNIANLPMKYLCYPYFEEDGIGDMTFNAHSITSNKQGEILIGGIGGYLKIIPKPMDFYNYVEHPVVFTDLIVANQRIGVGSSTSDGRILLLKNIQLLNEITMDYSDSNFALEVSSMDYLNQHKRQFAYRLGDKEEWVKMESNRIHFNKLSSGTFQLQVKVYEPNGFHSNPVSSLIIHVLPPLWLSMPAYCFYIILIILLFLLILRNTHLKHKRILEQQRHEMEIIQQHEMDETKMRFFTNVSHDLRTPLSLIITPLEKLLSLNLAQNLKTDLELIHRNAVALLNEVNQLLDFRKLDKQKTQLALSYGNLSSFTKEVCDSFCGLSAKNGIKLNLNLVSSDIDMYFDRNKMQRILLNLLSNAMKYNHENGCIIVTIDKILTSEGTLARIQVADTGIGIKDENKEKVFDRFFQEQHSTTYVGSGIGLHIVKEYVVLHNGRIKIEDNHPKGSIFVITLPIIKETGDTSATKDIVPMEFEVKNDTSVHENKGNELVSILIVEDNNDFRHFLISCLKEHFRVFDATNGKEALNILSQQSIQLVISDVMMPVMDGLELCHKIKTDIRFSHVPVILLTARTAEEHVLNGLREGADDYITKPFNLDILLIRIKKILKWAQTNHEKFRTIEVSPSEITISTLDEQLIEKAISIVEENMDNSEYSVEELSSQLGISRSGLYKKLMSITGKSPLEFMRILRLKRGRQLLEKSQLSISQIAYQVGLSPKQFAKYFKEEFGSLPSEYNKKK